MICKNCGSMLPNGAPRCSVCGANFVSAPVDPNAGRGTYIRSSAPAYEEPYRGTPGEYRRVEPAATAPKKEHVSVGGWIGRWLLGCIPFVGWLIYFIMLIVWANNDSYEVSFKNWAKAQLWIILIVFAIALVVLLFFFLFASNMSSSYYYY